MRRRWSKPSVETLTASYDAARASRWQRTRVGLGGGADRHYTQAQLWRMREYSRDMDRNDMLPFGAMFSMAAQQIVRPGLRVEPNTGDVALDEEIGEAFREWASDPDQVDVRGTHTLTQLARLAQRHVFVDGDVFVNPLGDGMLEVLEADRCVSPPDVGDMDLNFHVGVERAPSGRPVRYHFVRRRHKWDASSHPVGDMAAIDAYTLERERNLYHVFSPRRYSQTRGIPVFAAAQIASGMTDDLAFAQLVKAQVAAAVALFIEREGNFALGSQDSSGSFDDGNTQTLEALEPGLIIKGRPGEKINGFAPNVPDSSFFEHIRLLMRIIGSHIGLPLELFLYDTEHTTFHGYRGAVQTAREGFQISQDELDVRLLRPTYRWWLRRNRPLLLGGSATVARLAEEGRLFRHKWIHGRWPYVDPKNDAEADSIQLKNGLDSPRGIAAARGHDFDDICRETVEDRGKALELAVLKSQEIEARTGVNVDPMTILGWDMPGAGVSGSSPQPTDEEQPDEAAEVDPTEPGDGQSDEN